MAAPNAARANRPHADIRHGHSDPRARAEAMDDGCWAPARPPSRTPQSSEESEGASSGIIR
eukprot:7280409-Pyramimonas_sp.AAC.1